VGTSFDAIGSCVGAAEKGATLEPHPATRAASLLVATDIVTGKTDPIPGGVPVGAAATPVIEREVLGELEGLLENLLVLRCNSSPSVAPLSSKAAGARLWPLGPTGGSGGNKSECDGRC